MLYAIKVNLHQIKIPTHTECYQHCTPTLPLNLLFINMCSVSVPLKSFRPQLNSSVINLMAVFVYPQVFLVHTSYLCMVCVCASNHIRERVWHCAYSPNFLRSKYSWFNKYFRGCCLHYKVTSFVGNIRGPVFNHENHEYFTTQKLPVIRYNNTVPSKYMFRINSTCIRYRVCMFLYL